MKLPHLITTNITAVVSPISMGMKWEEQLQTQIQHLDCMLRVRLMQYALTFPLSTIQSLHCQSTENKQLRLIGVNNNGKINLGFIMLTNGDFMRKQESKLFTFNSYLHINVTFPWHLDEFSQHQLKTFANWKFWLWSISAILIKTIFSLGTKTRNACTILHSDKRYRTTCVIFWSRWYNSEAA